MQSRFFSRLVLCAGVLLLTACATRPPVVEPAAEAVWLAQRARLESLTHWQVQGRVGVRAGDEGWTADFDWQQQGDEYRIRLRGPFGQGAVELSGNGQGVWLTRADHPTVFARDAEALLEQETGWRLPVSGLSAWLRGLPVSTAQEVLSWDSQGRLQQVHQQGWHIDYRRYQQVESVQVPARMELQRDTLRVKLVLDAWQLL